jgi:hypothetical protein
MGSERRARGSEIDPDYPGLPIVALLFFLVRIATVAIGRRGAFGNFDPQARACCVLFATALFLAFLDLFDDVRIEHAERLSPFLDVVSARSRAQVRG